MDNDNEKYPKKKKSLKKEIKELFEEAQKAKGVSDINWDDDAFGYHNIAKRQLEDYDD